MWSADPDRAVRVRGGRRRRPDRPGLAPPLPREPQRRQARLVHADVRRPLHRARSATHYEAVLDVTVTNEAPASGEPRYVVGPYPGSGLERGEYLGLVTLNLPGRRHQQPVRRRRPARGRGRRRRQPDDRRLGPRAPRHHDPPRRPVRAAGVDGGARHRAERARPPHHLDVRRQGVEGPGAAHRWSSEAGRRAGAVGGGRVGSPTVLATSRGGGLVPATVVVGTQWGDEGKGKFTDLVAKEMHLVVRYQGGHNAGHTLVVDGETLRPPAGPERHPLRPHHPGHRQRRGRRPAGAARRDRHARGPGRRLPAG